MFEYVPDAELTARFIPETQDAQVATFPAPSRDLRFKVVKAFTPFTMSATMQIELDPQDPLCHDRAADGFVLKLYDRRAQLNTRRDLDQGRVHSADREAEYRDFISDPSRVPNELDSLCVYRHRDDPEHGALVECLLQESCDESFKSETQVYRRLWERSRGKPCPAPRFFGEVEFESDIGFIKGILIEYIAPSLSLADFIAQTGVCGLGAGEIASVCSSVMAALSYLHDCEVLNEDARMHNVVVRYEKVCPDGSDSGETNNGFAPRCFLLDFGHARLRYSDETELEWSRGKSLVNEDQTLAGDMMYDIGRVWKTECKIHGPACKHDINSDPALDKFAPVWCYDHEWRFNYDLTDEQVQLACEYNEWGYYESRPYPMTVAEWKQMKQTDPGSPVSNISYSP